MALVELATFYENITAQIVQGRLAAEGIETVLFDSGLASLNLSVITPVRLMVDEDDLSAARRLLAGQE